jgi:hypothetical protein
MICQKRFTIALDAYVWLVYCELVGIKLHVEKGHILSNYIEMTH